MNTVGADVENHVSKMHFFIFLLVVLSFGSLARAQGQCSNGKCASGLCCSKFGYCGSGPTYCTGGGSSGGGSGGNSGGSSGGGGGGGLHVSQQQFNKAVTCAGYPSPSAAKYQAFNSQAQSRGGISSNQEAAMFLANVIHETGGLQKLSEDGCTCANCGANYRSPGDATNVCYYGRGYLQLSWSYNYGPASKDLYGDNRLLTNPDQVATNEEIAWATAFWFWKTRVRNASGVLQGNFGASVRAINGGIECNGSNQFTADRFRVYSCTHSAFGVPGSAPTYSGSC